MPTTNEGYIRKLLRRGDAVVVQHDLFTVKLLCDTTDHTDKVTLGIDPGYSHVGFSAVSGDKELISGTLEQEGAGKKCTNPTSKRLADKLMYRRNRRSRLWHRKARWQNRASSKKKGWIAPSLIRKKDTHVSLVNRLKKVLPIDQIVIERNKFDIAAIENPEIQGVQYQRGTLYDYENKKSYLLSKQEGICPICGEILKTDVHLHHVKPRAKGGSDNADNMVALHNDCHKRLHREKLKLPTSGFAKKHKADTFMNIVRHRLVDELQADVTFGSYTKVVRIENGIEKTHYNDAFVIAGGTTQERCCPVVFIQKRKNNRSLQKNNLHTKGGRAIRRQRSVYQTGDLIWTASGMHRCGGMSSGYVILKDEYKEGCKTPIKISNKLIIKHLSSKSIWTLCG